MEMEEKIKKEYLRRTRKLLETKLNNRINTGAVSLVRYSGSFLKWTREKQIDQRTRKLMTKLKPYVIEMTCVKKRRKRTWQH